MNEQQQIDNDFDDVMRFAEAVQFAIGFAFLLIVALFCATHAYW